MAKEEDIANNPAALSPLLLKRDGVLTTQISAWCQQAWDFIDCLGRQLNIQRPNPFDKRVPCAAELLSSRLDALMTLGLPRLVSSADAGDGNTLRPELEVFLQELALAFLKLWHREIECIVCAFALRVAQEEPNGGSEDLKELLARRDGQARQVVQTEIASLIRAQGRQPEPAPLPPFMKYWLAQSLGNVAEAEGIPKEEVEKILKALDSSIGEFDNFRKKVIEEVGAFTSLQGLAKAQADQAAAGAAGADAVQTQLDILKKQVPGLVDRTLLFLRVEILKDVIEANYQPGMPKVSAGRPADISQAADALKASLGAMSGAPPEALGKFITEYCTHVFKGGRAGILNDLLGGSQAPEAPRVKAKDDGKRGLSRPSLLDSLRFTVKRSGDRRRPTEVR